MRDPDLQRLIDATAKAFKMRSALASPITRLRENFFTATETDTGRITADTDIETLPVCHHLAPALITAATGSQKIANVADALSHLAPRLSWRRRIKSEQDPEGFAANHANASVIGIDGLEERDDIRFGVSLIAPHITYPDHKHPPEEMYLVLSPGQWRNDETDWHEPGIGGVVYNPPGIGHAMRAGAAPLLAIWCLWSP